MKIGVSAQFVFVVVEREEKGKKYRWNFWFWAFFVQRWPFRDAYAVFKKCFAETPILMVFGGARFWAKLSKKGNFGPPKIKKHILPDN